MTEVPNNGLVYYDRDLRHEELTTLNNKFTESQNQKRRKRIISHVHIILISYVYLSRFMVSQMVGKATLAYKH